MPNFYVVATPIGNLKDISLRALETLKEVDLILCEDTRVTRKLLEHYEIKNPLLSYHEHSRLTRVNYILELLEQGKNMALVSDAGTPGISDPGNKLVEELFKKLGDKVNIIPIPGPSALTVAASISGFPMNRFTFLGFPPAKRKREKFFREAVESDFPVVFYESPHRIIKSLEDLKNALLDVGKNAVEVVACRELTKKFETVYRGKISEVLNGIKKSPVKGEFVVLMSKDDNLGARNKQYCDG